MASKSDQQESESLFPSEWTDTDRDTFYRAVRRFGTNGVSVEAIADCMGNKTCTEVLQVKEKLEALSFWCPLPEKYRDQDDFLTPEAEEVEEANVFAEDCFTGVPLQQEEEAFIIEQEKNRYYYSSTDSLLNPIHLLKYSERIYSDLFPCRGERAVFMSGQCLRLLESYVRTYIRDFLEELFKKGKYSKRAVAMPFHVISAPKVREEARRGKNKDVKKQFSECEDAASGSKQEEGSSGLDVCSQPHFLIDLDSDLSDQDGSSLLDESECDSDSGAPVSQGRNDDNVEKESNHEDSDIVEEDYDEDEFDQQGSSDTDHSHNHVTENIEHVTEEEIYAELYADLNEDVNGDSSEDDV